MLLVCHFILGDSRQRVFSKHRGRRQICFKEIVTPHKTRYHCLGFSGRTNEKKNCVEEKLDGLLPIFQFWVTIKHVVSRQAGRDTAWPACWGTQQSAATLAAARATRPGLGAKASGSAQARDGLAIVVSRYDFCIAIGNSVLVATRRPGATTWRPGAATRRNACAA